MSESKDPMKAYEDLIENGLSSRKTYIRLSKRTRPFLTLVAKPMVNLNSVGVTLGVKLSVFYPDAIAGKVEGDVEVMKKWVAKFPHGMNKVSTRRVGTELWGGMLVKPGNEEEFVDSLTKDVVPQILAIAKETGIELVEPRRVKAALIKRFRVLMDGQFEKPTRQNKYPKSKAGKVVAIKPNTTPYNVASELAKLAA